MINLTKQQQEYLNSYVLIVCLQISTIHNGKIQLPTKASEMQVEEQGKFGIVIGTDGKT